MTAKDFQDWFSLHKETILTILKILGVGAFGIFAYFKGFLRYGRRMLKRFFELIILSHKVIKYADKHKISDEEAQNHLITYEDIYRCKMGLPQPFKPSLYEKKGGMYFLRVPLHDGDTGPFCMLCADTKSAAIHLSEQPIGKYRTKVEYYCKSCQNHAN